MKNQNFDDQRTILGLISEYEAMSQKGTVGFYEETAFLSLIEFYWSDNRSEKALEVIEYALTQHPSSVSFLLKKAQIFVENKWDSLALDCLDQAALYAPKEFEIHLLRATALSGLGYHQDAFSVLEALKYNVSKQEMSEIYLGEAMVYESMERFPEMFYALRKSILNNPKNTNALTRIWFSVEMGQLYAESIELHLKLIDIDPYNYIAWYNLGYAYSATEEHKEARDAFEYAFLINEEFEFAYRHYAESCIKLGQYELALKAYEEALEYIDPDADLFLKIGYCYESLANAAMAKSFYQKALDLNPEDDAVYFRMGECAMEDNQWQTAIHYYKRAIQIEPHREEYLAALAEAYYQIDEDDTAAIFFQKAIDTAPELSQYWIQFASFLLDTGKIAEALEVMEDAEFNTGGVELQYCRVACLLTIGRRQEALQLLGMALSKDFDLHHCLFDIAPLLVEDVDIQNLVTIYQPDTRGF